MTEETNQQTTDDQAPPPSMLASPSDDFLQEIRNAVQTLKEIDAKRKDLTASKTATVERLAADHAVNKAAMLAAMRYVDLKDKDKENWDLTYQVVRKALGDPVQQDLFEAQLQRGVEQAIQGKRKH